MSDPEYFDEDSFVWLATDLPDAKLYATALLMTRRDLARDLLAARLTKDGWKFQYDPRSTTIEELRSLGLATVAGVEKAHGYHMGWHLTHFALVVRNRILDLIKSHELECPLDNGDLEEIPHD